MDWILCMTTIDQTHLINKMAMHIFILIVFILAQVILNFFLIGSWVAFGELMEIYGIPIHFILMCVLNIGSLVLVVTLLKNEETKQIKYTESTHEEQFRALVASVRSDRHDLNNHLTVVAGLLKIENYTSAVKYINEVIGEVKINNKALSIKNAVLASILFSKMELYQKHKVPFSIDISSEGITKRLTSTDLLRLVSNLLDNAYEATIELIKDKQMIAFEMAEGMDHYDIIVRNSCAHQLDGDFLKSGFSTKGSSQPRGFGLSIIQEVTKKYGGTLHMKSEQSIVVFHLVFPKGEK
ncbi:sensor histidine kinase [Halalkalibacter sp. APA_J-10(15)]|uniref:sensor histidine kinase n=1 Tax=unclassified Halalkalibacter TaxID=2893063 RepID=UPI001FF4C4FF|nr:GHKL domain-containing protein [Halalkalibacter sp. APA_J-10(15)]MCK0469895.1 GHKL domain-containing protein [Halalkalibacter sp. APA_J-10(15)]